MKYRIPFIVLALMVCTPVLALKSDREQPMEIEADEIGIDQKTGGRRFDGKVIAEQGSMRLEADKLLVETENDKLSKATAYGQPAVFRQRPDGKEQDVIGRALELEFDQVQDLLTLHQNASLTHGGDSIKGDIITYHLTTEKMKVRGGDTHARPEALKTDSEQPAAINADEMDLDFNTGERQFRGDVFMEQGTTKLNADKVDAKYNQEDELEKATAFGNPAVFRRLPEGEQHEVVGEALRLELDQIEDTVTLYDNASLTQRGDTIEGTVIVYNINTEQMTVRGGGTSGTGAGQEVERPRITIQPKPKEESTE